MPTVEKISIALPAEMVDKVRQAVSAGDYASSSEVIREALRDWNDKRDLRREGMEHLRHLWKRALEDDTPGVEADDVLSRLEKKYQALADKKRAR